MKTQLCTVPIKRFFAIGCSFTSFVWTTWSEIIAEDLDIEYYNLGQCGAGNEFIFNRLMQLDQLYNLNENDLVIICWTNSCREDRFVGEWLTPGNIFSQKEYSKEFVQKYYSEPENSLLHTFSFLKAARTLLEAKQVQWHFLQMLPIFDLVSQWNYKQMDSSKFASLIDIEKNFLKPSFYTVLWNDDINIKLEKESKANRIVDGHPSPKEHLAYLQHVFDHSWKQTTVDKVSLLEDEREHHLKLISSYEELFAMQLTHLKTSLEHKLY